MKTRNRIIPWGQTLSLGDTPFSFVLAACTIQTYSPQEGLAMLETELPTLSDSPHLARACREAIRLVSARPYAIPQIIGDVVIFPKRQ